MRISRNVLNNLLLDNQRKTLLYQAVITDLALVGAIKKTDAECLLGYSIPDFLKAPDGRTIADIKEDKTNELEKLKTLS